MVAHFNTTSRHFADELLQFLSLRTQEEQQVGDAVRAIIARVRQEGDAALLALTQQFDRCQLAPDAIRVTKQEMANALALATPELMKSLKAAASRIQAYSERQLPKDERYVDEQGVTLGWKWSAVESVGLYVPGGKASYPSSVLMNAIPARVAGVRRMAMTVPAPEGNLNPAVLAAAHVAGIEEIYRVGGAQAVAALAYGTETIMPVDKIVGPGNAYVTEAKRQVFGRVGIDMIAGPSEVVVVAGEGANPDWVAIDLLSQAEHAEDAQAILITNSHAYGQRVEKAVAEQLEQLPRAGIAGASWERFGAIVLARDWEEAAEVVNLIAPEHVELFIPEPERIEALIRHAGAVFLGAHTPEALGDYIAGPSHVLPTSRAARFASGLSVFDFLKRTSLIGATPESLSKIGQFAEVLGYTEGLQAHARSLFIRKKDET